MLLKYINIYIEYLIIECFNIIILKLFINEFFIICTYKLNIYYLDHKAIQ